MESLKELYQTIQIRSKAAPETSYTARLFQAGEDEIVKKIGEEAIEVVLATKQEKQRLVEEICDLTYHTLVLLAYQGISLEDIVNELNRRKK
jgi:phosphoribosyl-ATP pyrophosphohydrolase